MGRYTQLEDLTDEHKALLTRDDMSNPKISQITGYSQTTVRRLRRNIGYVNKIGIKSGVKVPSRMKRVNKTCPKCGSKFETIPSYNKRWCSISCWASDRNTSYMQSAKYRKSITKETTKPYKRYCNRVHKLSNRVYEENKDVINPDNFPRTICGVDGGYQLDHVISVKDGYEQGISPEEMAVVENLRMLPWRENLAKGRRSDDSSKKN